MAQGAGTWADTTDMTVKETAIHDCTAELYLSQTADKSSSILWLDEQTGYSYTIDGYLSEEQLIQMAKSVSQEK